MLLNNCCESFNNVLRECRDKPILSMMEWIRTYVMKRAFTKRKGLKKYEGKVMPAAMKILEKSSKAARYCYETPADLQTFEVSHNNDIFVVNLIEKTCGCFRWDLSGIPCCHAFKCIMTMRKDPEDYVHQAYSREAYSLAYEPVFYPMPGMKQWERTPYAQPDPPTYKKMPGRSSNKKRKKEMYEAESGKDKDSVQRQKKPRKCGNCGDYGHIRTKCKNDPAPPPPKGKPGRPPKENGPPQTKKAAASTRSRPSQSEAAGEPSTMNQPHVEQTYTMTLQGPPMSQSQPEASN